MADGTKIEWTDATWQIVTGCKVVSPGCTNCYAMRLAGTRLRHHPSRKDLTVESKAGPVWNGMVRFNVGWLMQPLHWRKPRDIFVAAHGDLFHDGVQDWMLDRIFAVMALTPWHRYQVLTKRAERMRQYLSAPDVAARVWKVAYEIADGNERLYLAALAANGADWGGATPWPFHNVWLGVSAEDQPRADERIPHLLATPAAVRWISGEPLLGVIDLRDIALSIRRSIVIDALKGYEETDGSVRKLDWVVAGGESGPGARPAHPDWFRALRDQCHGAGVPFFFKQWGAFAPAAHAPIAKPGDFQTAVNDGHGTAYMNRVGKKRAGALLDGREHREFPT